MGLSESVDHTLTEITSKDAKDRYYPQIDNTLYATIVALDPTYNKNTDWMGKYDRWLLQPANVDIIRKTKPEDLYKITEDIRIYDRLKHANKLPAEFRDIQRLNVRQLTDYIFANHTSQPDFSIDNITSQTQDIKNIKQDAEKYEVGDFTIIQPQTQESACFYGKGTRWCTASTDYNNQFDHYSRNGKLWILIDKDDPSEKYQFHFEDEQFMDAKDDAIQVGEFFGDHTEVYQFFVERYPQLDFIIAKYSIEHGTEDEFSRYYSDDFTDDQKSVLVNDLMNKIAEGADGNADSALSKLYNIKYNYKAYKDSGGKVMTHSEYDYRNALEGAAKYDAYNSSYNGGYYTSTSLIELFGGLTEGDVEILYNELHQDDMEILLSILKSFDNGGQLLNQFIADNDLQDEFKTKDDILMTVSKLKKMYPDYPRMANKIAKIYVRQVDFDNGTFNIELEKKDALGQTKKEYGNIDYRNIFDYLHNYSLFENRRLSPLLMETRRLRSLMELSNTELKVQFKQGEQFRDVTIQPEIAEWQTFEGGEIGKLIPDQQLNSGEIKAILDDGRIIIAGEGAVDSAENMLDAQSKEEFVNNDGGMGGTAGGGQQGV